ncbi:MAG: FtsQ-type POTRA domain-containing protein [Coriobacteriia bacterium]|nr:FtsQ-type POTRA domain-containing protein [Coriobacteriia bacterium]
MASSSSRKSGSSGRSNPRKRVVIGAHETVRVRYDRDKPVVESERTTRGRTGSARATQPPGSPGAKDAAGPDQGRGRQRHAKAPRSSQGKRLANTKRDERERRQRGIRLRRTLIAVLAVAGIVASLWGIVALAGSSVFAVNDVGVEGARHLSDEDVRTLAAVPAGATMFTLSTRAVERRVEKSPWVAEASVERDFPHGLVIKVEERRPAAVIDAGGKELWVVSADGWWLGERSAEESGVPVVRDVEEVKPLPGRKVTVREISNAARLVAGLSPGMLSRVAYVSAPSVEKTAVVTDEEVEVYFGEATDVATKERIALEILNQQAGKVVYINVRVVESPTWRGLE